MTDYNTIAETKHFIVLDRYQRDFAVKEGYQSEDALEREFIDDLVAQGYRYATDIRTPEAMLTNVRVQLESLNNVRFTTDEWQRFVEQYLDPASESSTTRPVNSMKTTFMILSSTTATSRTSTCWIKSMCSTIRCR